MECGADESDNARVERKIRTKYGTHYSAYMLVCMCIQAKDAGRRTNGSHRRIQSHRGVHFSPA